MSGSEKKKRWRKESNTLREDLLKRPKEIQKREVPIRLKSTAKPQIPPTKTSPENPDDWTRKQLGL